MRVPSTLLLAAVAQVNCQPFVPTLFPLSYGADGSGRSDSTNAFIKLMADLLLRNTSGHILSGKAVDLGGATIDLQGGDYIIGQPLAVPNYFGNYRIIDGTLRASASFPPDRFLLELGGPDVCPENQPQYASCAADVSISNLLLDGSGRAAGGLHASYHMGLNAGPNLYIVNFTAAGILVTGGHEVMIHQSWIGCQRWQAERGRQALDLAPEQQPPKSPVSATFRSVPPAADIRALFTPASISSRVTWAVAQAEAARARGEPWIDDRTGALAPGSPQYYVPDGTAGVVLTSNDHYLSDVVVFSGPTYGVIVSGAANLIRGVHTWNRANTDGGYGIVDLGGPTGGGNRYIGCYADCNDHVLYNPDLITLEGGFYLCGGQIILAATGANALVRSTVIAANQFSGTCNKPAWPTVRVDESNATFSAPVDVTVRDSMADGTWLVTATALTRSLTLTVPTTNWTIDFTAALLFNASRAPIRTIQHWFTLDEGQFALSSARSPPANGPNAAVVTVQTDRPVTGTLTVTVDQSQRSS